MKIRQALKLYNKSKKNLLKVKSIYDVTHLCSNTINFNQQYVFKYKSDLYRLKNNNINARTRVCKYLKNNQKVAFTQVNYHKPSDCTIEVTLKSDIVRNIYLDNLPQIGKQIYSYDDGKITPSRESSVTITDIIPFDKAPEALKLFWNMEVRKAYWLFATSTDYFIAADNGYTENNIIYFVRTIKGEWFSIGNDWIVGTGLLDTTGELRKQINNFKK